MIFYLAGPMRGYKNYNFDAFDKLEKYLTDRGHHVVSPASIDRLFEGWNKYPPQDSNFTKNDCIRFMDRDLNAIQGCEAIYMMDGWEESTGAKVEKAYADFIGIDVYYEIEGLI